MAKTVERNTWTTLSDAELLNQCAVDTYRASGPGGQKRNKTSSAVRLRHNPSGTLVIAEESRSQHENKSKALRRLRQALHLQIREPAEAEALPVEWQQALDRSGRVNLGRKDPRFWPAVAVALDVLTAVEGKVSEAACKLGISTGNLIRFLQTDVKVWQEVNAVRSRFGHKPLH